LAAGKIKVIELAKELGVTSKDLIVALEGMGHKGVRAMSPVLAATANELRVKLGRGRDLPAEAKPKRAPKPKPAEGDAVAAAAAGPPTRDLRGFVGRGGRLFPDGEPQTPLELVDSKTFSTGVVYLTYRPQQ